MEIKFWISSIVSLAIIGVSLYFVHKIRSEHPRKKRLINSLNVFIIGVFAAIMFIFFPVYFNTYYTDTLAYVRPLLHSFHNTMRVFILDGEFDTIKNAVENAGIWTQRWYTFYSAILYVLAPILTAGFILSMFKSVTAEFRLRRAKKRPAFFFSELNDRSIALAESINSKEDIKKPVFVFAEVYDKTQEEHYENVSRAKELGAILMQKDIVDIDFEKKTGRVEIFLIGEDESENVSQAVKIITDKYKSKRKDLAGKSYNERKNTKVFVFARSEGSARILDSLDKGNQYADIDEKRFENDEMIDDSELFRVRRIDDIQLLAWDSVENADIFEKYTEIDGEKVISVLLLGMGEYGVELFKTLVWYGQMKGYRLEINIVDKADGNASAKSKLSHICPEIISTNNRKLDGDAFYSIEFYEGIDVFNDSWDNLFVTEGKTEEEIKRAERLKRTTVAFVAFGNDDKNIQASVELRLLFDRVNGVLATADQPENELPAIYSIVYNEEKAVNLSGSCKKTGDCGSIQSLVTHKKQPYNITFIGSLSSQYQYDAIYREKLEKEAFAKCHMQWSYYSVDREIEEIEKKENRKVSDAERTQLRAAKCKEEIGNYENFEYFRISSMTKAMHKMMISEKFHDEFGCADGSFECNCEKCWARRRNEHNRWNAYTRSIGYVYGPKKSDRAKIHSDLIPFDELWEPVQRLD